MGLPDDDAFKAFNVFLTRCRKSSGLKNYIWVSERQKNATIHFHMITTDYMPIREINNYMAVTLSKYFDQFKAQGLFKQYATAQEFKNKYNGIDVEQIRNCARQKGKLATYISKYISKGNAVEFTRLVWHCSRSVSALFTDLNITEDEAMQILDHMEETGHEPKELEVNPYVSVYYLNVPNSEKAFYQLPDEYLRDLYVVNTEILNGYDTGKYN